MRKVTTINLNNNAYQIDEEGYDALRTYLDNAARAGRQPGSARRSSPTWNRPSPTSAA